MLGAIAAILAIVLSKKGKKPAPQPAPAPAAPTKNIGVRSLSDQHRGAFIKLGSVPITIGRGQDCAIVFKSETPGVSGHHCTLAYEPSSGSFVLTDMQSTYGTFLANGQKLTPNLPYRLRAGDQFYLGEPQNKLQVVAE